MPRLQYFYQDKLRSLQPQTLESLATAVASLASDAVRGLSTGATASLARESAESLAQGTELALAAPRHQCAAAALEGVRGNDRVGAFYELTMPVVVADELNVVTIPTASIILTCLNKTARKSEIKWLKSEYGMTVLEEGLRGKVLLRAPSDGAEGVALASKAAAAAHRRGNADAVSLNFLRVRSHRRIDSPTAAAVGVGTAAPALPWNLQNLGNPGVAGADVHAVGAWAVTKGDPAIRVAVLDEGVDTAHPALQAAIVAERDFIGTNPNARPTGNDAHGTACAGIVGSRDALVPGLAPNVSLVAARIARSNPANPHQWIFDDFKTADAIDWCWDDARADVLSNSWGGGLPSDAIRLAFERARTLGRGGKGSVIAIAAGNFQTNIPFPATLSNMLVVGASNQWDERKTMSSQDGESWWGSNFGPTLSLMAPGVKIQTTDISGTAGYSPMDFTNTFNGTSSATPHVAAAAALVLSVNNALTESQVRQILTSTTDPLTGPANEVGSGRLNAERALQAAQALVPPQPIEVGLPTGGPTPAPPKAKPKKKTSKKSKKKAATKKGPAKKPAKKSTLKRASIKKAKAAGKKASKKAPPKKVAKRTTSGQATSKKSAATGKPKKPLVKKTQTKIARKSRPAQRKVAKKKK